MEWEYTETFRIRGYEVDEHNRAPLPSLCAFMEEAAGNHAERLGFGVDLLQDRGITWVLARMQLEIYDLPSSGELVEVTTWPVEVERLQFRRDFIVRASGRDLVRAVTEWVVIDLESRRLVKIPDFIAAHETPDAPHALTKEKLRIAGQENAPELKSFVVRKADIDRNRHVNNVRFSDWMLESAPDDVTTARKLAGMQIIYRAEAVYGDTVVSRGSLVGVVDDSSGGSTGAALGEKAEFLHGLYRASDGQELVRAKTIWR